jgi:tetratricopeptide (TPR) repeat protein
MNTHARAYTDDHTRTHTHTHTHTQKRALELYEKQLAVTREHGGRAQEAKALGNVGNAHILKGDYLQGCQLLERALAMFESVGDTTSAAVAMQSLAQFKR